MIKLQEDFGNYTITYPGWKIFSFVIMVCLVSAAYYFSNLALDNHKNEYNTIVFLQEQYDLMLEDYESKFYGDYPFNPAIEAQAHYNEAVSIDPLWKRSRIILYSWAVSLVFAFPYIRKKKDSPVK